jgi:hypothetical protein
MRFAKPTLSLRSSGLTEDGTRLRKMIDFLRKQCRGRTVNSAKIAPLGRTV